MNLRIYTLYQWTVKFSFPNSCVYKALQNRVIILFMILSQIYLFLVNRDMSYRHYHKKTRFNDHSIYYLFIFQQANKNSGKALRNVK